MPKRIHLSAIVITLLLVSGCRTYGGYDSKELNAEALTNLAEQVASTLETAEGDLSMLAQAAQGDETLTDFANEFTVFVNRHKDLADRLSSGEAPSSYRGISRAIGAAVAEMNIVSSGYEKVKMETAQHRGVQVTDMQNVAADISYEVVPPYFRRIDLHQSLSMRDVLN